MVALIFTMILLVGFLISFKDSKIYKARKGFSMREVVGGRMVAGGLIMLVVYAFVIILDWLIILVQNVYQ